MRAWLLGTGSGAGICVQCNIVLVCRVEGSECEVTHHEVNVDNFICEHFVSTTLSKNNISVEANMSF